MDLRSPDLLVLLQGEAQLMQTVGHATRQIAQLREKIRKSRKRKPREYWNSPMLVPRLRQEVSQFYVHLQVMRNEMPEAFKKELRIKPELFDEMLERITPDIMGPGTNYRPSLEPGLKLSVVLKLLAHGSEQIDMWTDFVVSRSAICNMIVPVCEAIQKHYRDEVFHTPTTADEWLAVADDFEKRWQLPHTLGALDGKHCKIKMPKKSGSEYWCVYKKMYSLVLMALVDARYRFIWADVGGVGSSNDALIYNNSSLKEHLDAGTLNIPAPSKLSKDRPLPAKTPAGHPIFDEDGEPVMQEPPDVPYYLIGDDAFALSINLMKPISRQQLSYEESVYSYRISRARRCVENAFGIMAHRWRVLYKEMGFEVEKCRCIIKTCIVLHNLLRTRYPGESARAADVENEDGTYVMGQWRSTVGREEEAEAPGIGFKNSYKEAKRMQQYLMDYVVDQNRGGVPWQDNQIVHRRRNPGRVEGYRVMP